MHRQEKNNITLKSIFVYQEIQNEDILAKNVHGGKIGERKMQDMDLSNHNHIIVLYQEIFSNMYASLHQFHPLPIAQ